MVVEEFGLEEEELTTKSRRTCFHFFFELLNLLRAFFKLKSSLIQCPFSLVNRLL